jgi:hypothetical protein
MIHVAWPGINEWRSPETLKSFPATSGTYANSYDQAVAEWTNSQLKSNGPIKTWDDVQKSLEKQNGPSPGAGINYPGVMYNTRIHPLAPFAIRGMILIQGIPPEEKFIAQIKQWREVFGQDFSLIVGTHTRDTMNYQPPLNPTVGWFYRTAFNIRNAVPMFGENSKVDYAELYDVGDFSVHYLDMAESARRMGLAALTKVYGESHDYTGPRIKESKIEGDKAQIEFEDYGTGLVYHPSINGISGIYLRGADGVERWANVKLISPTTIECSHPDIKKVQCVAYGYWPNAHETLFNSDGIQASPFDLNPNKINYANFAKPDNYSLVKFENAVPGLIFNLSHVRRDGYVFSVLRQSATSPTNATVLAYVPDEWKGCEVEADGKDIPAQTVTDNGAKFVRFAIETKSIARNDEAINRGDALPDTSPLKQQNIIVADTGKAAEFRKINRY